MPLQSVRVGDQDDAYGTATTGSPNVFVNDLPVVRVEDSWEGPLGFYSSAEGSPTVFANDLPRCRVGDATTMYTTMVDGSPDVMVN